MIQNLPNPSEQRKFLQFFYEVAGAHDMIYVKATLDNACDAEVKKMVIGQLPCFYEMGWTDDKISAELKIRRLPELHCFKKLNSGYVKKLLKLKRLRSQSDVLILKETKENALLSDDQVIIADRLLALWEI